MDVIFEYLVEYLPFVSGRDEAIIFVALVAAATAVILVTGAVFIGRRRTALRIKKAEAPEKPLAVEAIPPAAVEPPAEAPPAPTPEVRPPVPEPVPAQPPEVPTAPPAPTEGLLSRMRAGLSKTRSNLTEGLTSLFTGGKRLDDALLEEIETRLLMADVGVEATQAIIDGLTSELGRQELVDSDRVMDTLSHQMTALLQACEQPLEIPTDTRPFVILVVGVNGVGKTTTIGKLANRFKQSGHKVMLAAGDTFRAAAVEQLQRWGERNEVPVVAQHTGADSASVIHDAVEAARARGVDVLIADTAGRLHTQSNLMSELSKIKRVIAKLDPEAPHEVMLVVDGGTGQNALNQANQFNEAVKLTGLTVTKLDGTAKGGIVFAMAKQLGIPIRYIGIGEGAEDLRTFRAEPFVSGLLGRETTLAEA